MPIARVIPKNYFHQHRGRRGDVDLLHGAYVVGHSADPQRAARDLSVRPLFGTSCRAANNSFGRGP